MWSIVLTQGWTSEWVVLCCWTKAWELSHLILERIQILLYRRHLALSIESLKVKSLLIAWLFKDLGRHFKQSRFLLRLLLWDKYGLSSKARVFGLLHHHNTLYLRHTLGAQRPIHHLLWPLRANTIIFVLFTILVYKKGTSRRGRSPLSSAPSHEIVWPWCQ